MRLFVIALLLAQTLAADVGHRVEGRVLTDGAPLPGCTVTLSGDSGTAEMYTDGNGQYTLPALEAGVYELTMELSGFDKETRSITVRAETTTVPDVELQLGPIEITLSCGSSAPCSETAPESPFDEVTCSDYELNDALIETAKHGDRSAIDLLRQRHASTFPYEERHRIAAALLGRVADDSEYWNELSARAADAIRFAYVDGKPTPEFQEWCATHEVDPDDYRWMSIDALLAAAPDRRAVPLLLKALESADRDLSVAAFIGLLDYRDETFLPVLEQALQRLDDWSLAFSLTAYRSDAADQVALKFLPEESREEYWEQRRRADCETMTPCDP